MTGDQGDEQEWAAEDWAAWRAENARLVNEGWTIGTRQMLDGSVVSYASKDGVEIRRDPKWKRDEDGNYIYG